MECKFCGAEVALLEKCAYCGRVAEVHYYPGVKAEVKKTIHCHNTSLPAHGIYIVKSGDSLWNIAKRIYGEGRFLTLIVKANRELIKRPFGITPGMCLIIPEIGSEGYG
ncbi:MAG: LysM peptidoglycan-binding domain-containing protein [Clostridia bacterium]|nr:LysM peptidoglycan-binding domain-containing protein [Clostridia bacterium]